jgi:glycosyltransferase involved in cell wall biosynthesis
VLNLKKVLVLAVSDYPFGYGEPYLEAELRYVAPHFDRVLLVTGARSAEPPLFAMPPNAELVFYRAGADRASRWKALLCVFQPLFVKELLRVLPGYRIAVWPGIVKTLLVYLSRGAAFKRLLEDISGKSPESRMFLYSYWCTEQTFGMALWKKENPEGVAFTRLHGWDLYTERSRYNYLPLRELMAAHLDALHTVSLQGKSYLLKRFPGIPKDKVHLSRLGTESVAVKTSSRKENHLEILSIFFLAPVKRMELLLEALAHIKTITVRWTHVGGGEGLKEIQERAAQELNSNVTCRFTGTLDRTAMEELFRSQGFDAMLNVSASEGIPVSLMQGLSYGIPCVATNVGGIPEMIKDGYNGILLPPDPSPAQVAEALERISALSDLSYTEMRTNARAAWEELFNAEKNYTRFAELISSPPSRER